MTVDNVFHEEQGRGVESENIFPSPSCGANREGNERHFVVQCLSLLAREGDGSSVNLCIQRQNGSVSPLMGGGSGVLRTTRIDDS